MAGRPSHRTATKAAKSDTADMIPKNQEDVEPTTVNTKKELKGKTAEDHASVSASTEASAPVSALDAMKARLEKAKAGRSTSVELNRKDVRQEFRNKQMNRGLQNNKLRSKNLANPHYAVKQEQTEFKKLNEARSKLEKLEAEGKSTNAFIVLAVDPLDRQAQLGYSLEEHEEWNVRNIKKSTNDDIDILHGDISSNGKPQTTSNQVDYNEVHRKKYNKQIKSLGKRKSAGEENPAERLANIVKDERKQAGKFSRRRIFDEQAVDFNYINEGNMQFNKKIERIYGEEAKEIKQSLERGTAL